jgi:ABC-type glutathione transport system ATPase component
MERIAVIGCGGSGKTTLSRRLGELLELPVIHIDDQYWSEVDGARVESTPEQWRQRHRKLTPRHRPRVLALLGAYGGHVVVLRRRRDVRRLVDQIGRRRPLSARSAAPASHDCASTLPSSIVNVPPANGVGRSST